MSNLKSTILVTNQQLKANSKLKSLKYIVKLKN